MRCSNVKGHGGTPAWARVLRIVLNDDGRPPRCEYLYDALGRTVQVLRPNNSGSTVHSYSGGDGDGDRSGGWVEGV